MHVKTKTPFLAAAGALALGGLIAAGPVFAQGMPQKVVLARIDVQKLGTGFRTTKIVGAEVVNQAGDKVGTVDDLIVEPDESTLVAVLSVGGFLGVADHLVAVPFSSLDISKDKIVLPGATKDELKALPEFKYSTK